MTQTSARFGGHDYVIVGAGQRRRRAGGAAHRGPRRRACCCSRPAARPTPTRSSIPAAFAALFKTQVGLELHDHRAEAAARPAGLLAADEGARRLLVDERDDLHPRQPGRLRHLARPVRRRPAGATTTCCPTSSRPRATPGSARRPRPGRAAARRGPRLHPRAEPTPGSSSAVSAGLKPTDDFNGAEQEGAGLYQVTCKKGRRWSVNEAYLKPARDRAQPRPSTTGAFATRIVVEGGRAIGVDLPAGGARAHGARRPRGAALRRRDQQPAAADALRHRAGRPPRASVGVDVDGRPGRRRRRTCRTTRSCRCSGTPTGTTDLAELNNVRNFAALEGARHRAARLQHRRGRRRSSRSRDDLPRPTSRSTWRRPASTTTACTSRPSAMVTAAPTLVSRAQPRLAPAALGRPDAGTRTIDAAYYDDQADLDAMLAGHEADLGDLHARARWRATSTGRGSCPDNPTDERPRRARPHLDADALPPDLDLRDGHRRGRRGRPRAAGPRRRRAARRRRLGHAGRPPRQHQRTHRS